MINLSAQKRNPADHSGWSLDFEFLLRVAKSAEEYGEEVSMESIQAVLLATEAVFNEIQQKKYNTVIPSTDFDLVPGKGYQEVKVSKD